jgi:hypothetical protein
MTTHLDSYCHFYETLRPETLDQLDGLTTRDVRFKDPFNDVQSRDHMKRIFAGMFRRLDEPLFIVHDRAVGSEGAFLRWTMQFKPKGTPNTWLITGLSDVRFSADGLISSHIDHWDAGEQFYEKLPVIGGILRLIKHRMAD